MVHVNKQLCQYCKDVQCLKCLMVSLQGCVASWSWMLGLSRGGRACCGQVGQGPEVLLRGEGFPTLSSNR